MEIDVAAAAASVPAIAWSLTADAIATQSSSVIAEADAVLNKIASYSGAACTWESCLAPLAALDRDMETKTAALTFLKDVSTDEGVRSASAAAQSKLSSWEISAGMREDVFNAVRTAVESLDQSALDYESKRFVDRTMRDYKRRGLFLPADKRAELAGIKTLLSELCIEFQQRLGEWDVKLYFTKEELAGMPDDWMSGLETAAAPASGDDAAADKNNNNAGKLIVTLSYPHVVPLLKQCKVAATREQVEKAFNSRGCPDNVKLLEQIATLRRYAAHILGYPNHAAFVLEERMSGSPTTVDKFLAELQRDLLPLHNQDLADLHARKKTETGNPSCPPVDMADYRYYQEQDLSDKYQVDHEAIKAYFPLEPTLASMFGMYQTILALKFTLLPSCSSSVAASADAASSSAASTDAGAVPTWHPDVQVYAVHDNSGALEASGQKPSSGAGVGVGGDDAKHAGAWMHDAPKHGALMGYFYLDLHPRQGKYTHAAVFPLVSGCASGPITSSSSSSSGTDAGVDSDGKAGRTQPVCAMVCNFPKPTATTPSLLRHEEVETLFHEFGHVMHHICSRTKYHRFASFRCENDFVEAPSQMLEEWVWAPETLKQLSSHFAEAGKQLPDDLATKLAASRNAHTGLFNTRQVFLGLFDFKLHTLPAIPPPAGVSFAHLAKSAAAAAETAGDATGAAKAESESASKPSEGKTKASADRPSIPVDPEVDTGTLLKGLHSDVLRIPMSEGTNFGASFGHLVGGYDSQYYGYLWSEVYSNDMFDSVFKVKGLLNPEAGYRYRSFILAPGGARDAAESLRLFLGREPSNAAFLKLKGLKA